jgi:hypothetical protein
MFNVHWLSGFTNFDYSAGIRLRAKLFLTDELAKISNFSIGPKIINDPDLIIVGKPGKNNFELQLEWLIQLQNHKNKIIVVDYIDDYIERNNNKYSNFIKDILNKSNFITCSSNKMKERLASFYHKKITVIEDPYEFEINQNLQKKNTNNFLWFGNPNNLKYLFNLIKKINIEKSINLLIQTNTTGLKICSENYQNLKKENINLFFDNWSLKNMIKVIPDISGIFIPGDINDPIKNLVSSNRLLNSLALGRPVAASNYDSYIEFKDYYVDIDNKKSFENFLSNPLDYNFSVVKGQEKIQKYSKHNQALKWKKFIETCFR